jgi:hypothetical protein
MDTLIELKEKFVGKIVTATSAEDYSKIHGKCTAIRECPVVYVSECCGESTAGSLMLVADIEYSEGVKVVFAKTLELKENSHE